MLLLPSNKFSESEARRRPIDAALDDLREPTLASGLDRSTCALLLKVCSKRKDLNQGRRIHASITKLGLQNDTVLCNLLLAMYAKCGSPHEAQRTFDQMLDRDVVSWTSLISAYALQGHAPMAIQILHKMSQHDVNPNQITFLSLIRSCVGPQALQEGRLIHGLILKSGMQSEISLGCALICMYARCGSLKDAEALFGSLPQQNVVSWSSMMGAYAEHGHGEAAIRVFKQMLKNGVDPNRVSFMIVLKACASVGALEEGKHIHELILQAHLHTDMCVSTSLVRMYAKCGRLEDARRVFDRTPGRDVVSWTAMITAYADSENICAAFDLFERMMQEGIKPDRVTLVSLLFGCVNPETLVYGRSIHACVNEAGLGQDVGVQNALLGMYARCNSMVDASKIFEQMPIRDTTSWSTMMTAHTHLGVDELGFKLLGQMQLDGFKPNATILVSILNACADAQFLEEGKWMHSSLVNSGSKLELLVGTALVDMYGKCGSVDDAREAFDRTLHRDAVIWTTMIAAYSDNGHSTAALRCFWQMQTEGIKLDKVSSITALIACRNPEYLEEGKLLHALISKSEFAKDIVVGNSLLSMYGMCGSLKDAEEIFDNMPKRDVVSWNTMVGIYVAYEKGTMAIKLFKHMQKEGVHPDKVTLLNIVDACASLACLTDGKLIHQYIFQSRLESDMEAASSLLNMYGRCGSIKDAHNVFAQMYQRDLVVWNALAAAYARFGNEVLTFQVIGQMQWEGLILDDISFLSILSACNNAGLVDEGRHYFPSATEI